MAEARDDACVVPLNVYGDEKLKQFLERSVPGIEVTCNKQRLELKGSKTLVVKAQNCFLKIFVDHYRKQLIITEDLPLIYLNEHLGVEVCYLLKDSEVVYACIPHHKKQECAKSVSNLIAKNIIKQNLENCSEDLSSKINDLMISHSGKIICIEDSILVYTADISKDVDEVIGKRLTGREAEDKTTQDTYDVCIDEDGKRFIETLCPGVKVCCSDKGFSLHYNKSAMQDRGQIKIVNLDIDNRKLQLILTEDKARKFLNKQLKASGIVGYVMKNDRTICSLTLPGNRKEIGRITSFIDENILVKQLDNQDDSDLLIDYSGKLTHLVQEDKTYLVFTKDIEMEIISFLNKQVNPAVKGASMGHNASGCMDKMKQDEAERDGIRYIDAHGRRNRKASESVRVTKSDTNHTSLRGEGKSDKNALTKGLKEHEDFNNASMIQQTGGEHGRRLGFKGSEESNNEMMKRQTGTETFEEEDHDSIHFENDLAVSYENLIAKTNMDADVADYIFTHMGSFISELENRNCCSIENKYGTIILSGQCDRTAMEKVINRIHEMARSVVMDSSYIVEDEVKATLTDTFKDLKDKLKRNGIRVQLYPCDEARTVNVFMYNGVEIQLVHGSAADGKQTDVILCPLDANLKPMSAAGHHIMIKGGEPLRVACQKVIERCRKISDFQMLNFNETGQLQVKYVFAMVVDNLYVGTSVTEENIRKKMKHLFHDMIFKHGKSVTIPLEFGQRTPITVMLNACCKGLKEFVSDNPNSILTRVNLCCVNDSHLPLITELLKSEFRLGNQDTFPATEKVKTAQQEIYGPSRVRVVLNTESLIDQRVDAIAVPVNSKLDLTQEAVSLQVLNAAGGSIQRELKTKRPKGTIGPMEVEHTSPGYLPMKYILYSNLPHFIDGAYGLPEMRLGKVMEQMFTLVKKLGIKSLALPCLGTGGLSYPTELVAIEMMRSIYMHAAQSGVNTVNIVVYKVSPEHKKIFEKTLREYQDTVNMTYKACMMKPIFVDICNPDWKHCNKVVETSTEVKMADAVIYLRESGSFEINDWVPCERMRVRKLETLSKGLVRTMIFLDLSSVDNLDQKALYQKSLEYAVIDLQSQFLVIDVTQFGAERIRVIIENILRKVDTVLRTPNRLTKLYFLVSPESLESCVGRTKGGLSRTENTNKSFLGKLTNMMSGSPHGLEWQVKESKVPFTSGANLIMCSDNEEKLQTAVQAVRSKFSEYRNETIDDILDTGEVNNRDMIRKKSATHQNLDSDDGFDYSVKMYCHISAEVKNTVVRHLSRRKLKSCMASLEKKTIHAEYKNETIKIPDPYGRKANLAVALQNELSSLDKTVYFVRDVTSPMLHLLELYQRQTANKMKYVYVEAEQEIKIRDSLEVYETIKEKCKMFLQYQIDNIDVSKASVSVRDKIRELNSMREPRFENILMEVLKGNKAINIHYHVNEQNSALEMKNILLVQLGLFKPTGRRNSITSSYNNSNQRDSNHENRPSDMVSGRLGGSATLRPGASCFSSKSQRLDVQTDKEQGSQYGDKVTSTSPSMPSRNTNAMSDEIFSYTSSYSNTNQRDSNHGNRPSDMVSGRLRGKATLRPEAPSFSSKGAYSLPVSGRRLDVQTDKTNANEEPIKEAFYCTEKHLVIKVYNGNILKLDVDCIVNAANDQLFQVVGLAGAISRAAGREFDKESRDYINDNGSLDVGQCISTGAGRLPYHHVLHAVGPQWAMYEDKGDCEYDLMMTIFNTLRRAEVLKMKSVAIPPISSGLFGVPWNVCAVQYARGVEKFEENSQGVVEEVHFVDINSDILEEIRSVFSHMFKVLASHED